MKNTRVLAGLILVLGVSLLGSWIWAADLPADFYDHHVDGEPYPGVVVTLKTGGVFEGLLISDQGKKITMEVSVGTIGFDRNAIASIKFKKNAYAEFKEKESRIPAGDAKALWELALWAQTNNLGGYARALSARIIVLEPDHLGARALLGYERIDGEWMNYEQAMQAKGFVEFRGHWIAQAERERILKEEETVRIQREAERLQREEEARLRTEGALRETREAAEHWAMEQNNYYSQRHWQRYSSDYPLIIIRRAPCSRTPQLPPCPVDPNHCSHNPPNPRHCPNDFGQGPHCHHH